MLTDSPWPGPLSKLHKLGAVAALRTLNRVSSASIVDPDSPVDLSLTTYGERTRIVGHTIESIAQGTVLPRRLILWVSDSDFKIEHHPMLMRLRVRGLEVCSTRDYGPHKKSYPYAARIFDGSHSLVTVDDDTLYPRRWLERLLDEHARTPEQCIGFRAHRIGVSDSGQLLPYGAWTPMEPSGSPSPLTLLTGNAGLLMPPRLLRRLRQEKEAFLETAPRADDLWVNLLAQRAGVPRRVVSSQGMHLLVYPRSQRTALFRENVDGKGNDHQLRTLVSSEDLKLWRAASGGGDSCNPHGPSYRSDRRAVMRTEPGPLLVLASQSPGRAGVLRAAGIGFEQLVSNTDEEALTAASADASPAELVLLLARAKAEAVAQRPEARGRLVVGCDSLFELDGEVQGKPYTAERAAERLRAQSGRTGLLHTGQWVVDTRGEAPASGAANDDDGRDRPRPASGRTGSPAPTAGRTVSTAITFAELAEDEIQAYAATGEPLHCAGSFTIDGRGAAFIAKVDGDPSAVVGISVAALREQLAELGVRMADVWTPAD